MRQSESTTQGIFRGTVTQWKGTFGFIQPDDGSAEIFVHFSAIDSQQKYRKLLPEQVVEFEKAHGEKGPLASHVKVIAP